jgi:predicted PurR-regulated permease PerM
MLGIDRKAARATWTAVVILLVLVLFYLLIKTLLVFVFALLFAYLVSPLVDLIDRVLPASRRRTPALALAYIIFVGVVAILVIQVGSRVAEQANRLAKEFPPRVTKWMQTPSPSPTVNSIKEKVLERVQTDLGDWSTSLLTSLPQAGAKFVSLAGELVFVVIIPILAFFFLKDGREIRQQLLDLVEPGPRRVLLDDVMADVHILLAQYMRALVVLSIATFVAYSIFFAMAGVPYGVLLSAVAALLEFIPMIGPLTAAIAILIVAGVAQSHVLAILIFLAAYRLFQDYVLQPHLMSQGVQLHPLLVIFGVFAGGEVGGIAGTFLSVPALALVRILYRRIRRSRLNAQLSPTTPVPL